jgi:exopolysaccharide biosynthesis polyprenyl glycosylphosphotransferase
MQRKRQELRLQAHQMIDALILAGSLYLAYQLREVIGTYFFLKHLHPFGNYVWLYLLFLPLGPYLLEKNGFYNQPVMASPWQLLWPALKSVGLCVLASIGIIFVFQDQREQLSRTVLVMFGVVGTLLIFLKQALWQFYSINFLARNERRRTVVLVGSHAENVEILNLIKEHPEWGLNILGMINLNQQPVDELMNMLHQYPINCVIFTAGRTYFNEVEKAILACETEGVEVWLMADFIKTSIARTSFDEFHGRPMLVFRSSPDVSWPIVIKNLIDLIGAAIALLIFGPLLLLPVAIIIKLTSRGPILFKQVRCGLQGRLFTMYKFRSMVTNAEQLRSELDVHNEMSGPVFKMSNDPRVTRIGRFIRKTSIDEFPQLFNVLKGEMSLVGPRPPIPTEVEKYDPWQRRRLSMKPGITCLWQISGRNKIGFEEWMRLDLKYIDSWSLWLDFKILLRTIPVVIVGFGAK